MHNVSVRLRLSVFANLLLASLFILATVVLINERSQDIVRITVWDDELLPTVRTLQGVTGKVAYAYPIADSNGDVKHWRIVIDERSELNVPSS